MTDLREAENDDHSSAVERPAVSLGSNRSNRPSLAWRALHLFALSGFAFAQPSLDVLGTQPDFWIARQATALEVVVFVVVVVGLIPAIFVGLEWVVAMVSDRVAWAVHLSFVGFLAFVIFMMVIDNLSHGLLRASLVLGLAAAVAAVFARLYQSVKFVRDFLVALAFAPLVFVALFVFRLPSLGAHDVPVVDAGISEGNSVVLVVLDEFHLAGILDADGQIDETRFPGVAALADASTWYRYATTVHDDSLRAVPAILSGSIPEPGQLAVSSDYPVNLFTTLGSTHTLIVDEGITRLCPPSLCISTDRIDSPAERAQDLMTDSGVIYLHSALPHAWSDRLPDIGQRWGNFLASEADPNIEGPPGSAVERISEVTGGERRAVSYGRFLDSLEPASGSALYYLHIELPHMPWTFLPSGSRYPEIGLAGVDAHGYWTDDPWLVQQGYVRSVLHAGFVDGLLSDTVDRLKELGMWDDSLVVFVADHGQEFAVNDERREFTDTNLVGLGAVPLFIKYPYQTVGVRDDSNVQTIDVLPTIIAALGGELEGLDGVALQGTSRPDHKTLIAREWTVHRVEMAEFVAMDAEYLSRMLALAPAGVGFEGIFGSIGPRSDLVGRTTESLASRTVSGTVTFDDYGLFLNYDPTSIRDPVGIKVRVDADETAAYYAVAVNGTILATITPYGTRSGSAAVLAIVPPGSFAAGDNEVEVFGIEGEPGATTLVRFE